MRELFGIVLWMLGVVCMTSCGSDDVTVNVDCSSLDAVSLADEVMPVITANCALTGCHRGDHSPNLSTSAAVRSNSSHIRSELANGSMPPTGSGVTLTADERKILLCWIEQGAADN